MRFLNSVPVPKNAKGGTCWDFFIIHSVASYWNNWRETLCCNPKNCEKSLIVPKIIAKRGSLVCIWGSGLWFCCFFVLHNVLRFPVAWTSVVQVVEQMNKKVTKNEQKMNKKVTKNEHKRPYANKKLPLSSKAPTKIAQKMNPRAVMTLTHNSPLCETNYAVWIAEIRIIYKKLVCQPSFFGQSKSWFVIVDFGVLQTFRQLRKFIHAVHCRCSSGSNEIIA